MRELLPKRLLDRAYRCPDGRLAWKRSDAEEVARFYTSHGWMLQHAQVIRLSLDKTYIVFIPLKDGALVYPQWDFPGEWCKSERDWSLCCEQSRQSFCNYLIESNWEERVAPAFQDQVRYTLDFVCCGR